MSGERGSGPIWFLGLALAVLMVGAVSFELWRGLGERQQLAALADSAALAAASGLDLELYRSTGRLAIDSAEAPGRAGAVLAGSSPPPDSVSVVVSPDRSSVAVTLSRTVPYSLIRILALPEDEFRLEVTAVAYPLSP